METEVACERDIKRVFPTSFGNIKQPFDGGTLAFEAFAEERLAPAVGEQSGFVEQLFGAADTSVGGVHPGSRLEESGEVVLIVGILEGTLWNPFAAGVEDILVGGANDMEDDVIVGMIEVVLVLGPIARSDMYLDVADPFLTADADAGMTVVGTCVVVMFAYGEYLHGQSVGGLLRKTRPEAMLPNIM